MTALKTFLIGPGIAVQVCTPATWKKEVKDCNQRPSQGKKHEMLSEKYTNSKRAGCVEQRTSKHQAMSSKPRIAKIFY
jgi:hypothetical protein